MNDHRVELPRRSEATADPRAALLFPGSPRDVLGRIVPGDPLSICPRSARLLSERAVFLDPRDVARRVYALVARGAVAWRGEPELETWLDERVAKALEELLDEQADRLACAEPEPEAPRCGPDPLRQNPRGHDTDALATPLGLDRTALEIALARFHALPEADRRAFCAAALEEEAVEPGPSGAQDSVPGADARLRRARRALRVLQASLPPSTSSYPPTST